MPMSIVALMTVFLLAWLGITEVYIVRRHRLQSREPAARKQAQAGDIDQAKYAAGVTALRETSDTVLDPAAILRLKATLGENAEAMTPGLARDLLRLAERLSAESNRAEPRRFCARGPEGRRA